MVLAATGESQFVTMQEIGLGKSQNVVRLAIP